LFPTTCSAAPSAQATAAAPAPGFEYIQLTIKKPLGLVLAERVQTGDVFVEEVAPGGNAASTGQVRVGDVVSKTSATVLKSSSQESYGKAGHGDRLYDSWETVEFECEGQTFDTVMSAIGSNNER
jgi:S1-C subfamily serine protease